jgi:transcriptional antiterminator
MNNNFLTLKEIQKKTKLPYRTVYYLLKKFNIKTIQYGVRNKKYDVNQFLSELKKNYPKWEIKDI